MQIVKIPILPPSQAVDEIGLKGFGAKLYNGYIDKFGNLNRRPGLKLFATLGTSAAVDGLYWWDEQGWAIAVSSGNVYKITANDGTFSQISADGDDFETATRAIFANFGTDIYGANGGKIIKIPSSGNTDHISDADAPTEVTHVITMDRYLLANEVDSGNFHWSDVNVPGDWSAEYTEAEQKPDNLLALGVAYPEIYALGRRTMEMFRDDGSTPFVKEIQGSVNSGTIAAYSLLWAYNHWHWLDNERRIVRLVGRTPQSISPELDKYIQGFSLVTDALSDYVLVEGKPFMVVTFPSEDVTLACDLTTNYWYEWSYWENSSHKRWRGNCACLATAWNKVLIGDHSNGKIYELDSDTYQDNSSTMRTVYRTNHINHGTESRRKLCRKLVFRVKRTNAANAGAVVNMTAKWRDNGKTTWGNEKTVALGQVGDTMFRGFLNSLGSYYSRQWEFIVTGNAALTIAEIEEHIDVARY